MWFFFTKIYQIQLSIAHHNTTADRQQSRRGRCAVRCVPWEPWDFIELSYRMESTKPTTSTKTTTWPTTTTPPLSPPPPPPPPPPPAASYLCCWDRAGPAARIGYPSPPTWSERGSWRCACAPPGRADRTPPSGPVGQDALAPGPACQDG